jgi:hypothetical protein
LLGRRLQLAAASINDHVRLPQSRRAVVYSSTSWPLRRLGEGYGPGRSSERVPLVPASCCSGTNTGVSLHLPLQVPILDREKLRQEPLWRPRRERRMQVPAGEKPRRRRWRFFD